MAIKAIDRAREVLGGTSRLAVAVGVKPPTVSEWINGKRPIPLSIAIAIERETGGAVTVEELRPDVDWSVIRGKPAVAQEAA